MQPDLKRSHLRDKAFAGLFWSFVERMGSQAVRFAISIILARLLLPAEFGLLGMLVVFMALAQLLIDSGFGQALIQKHDPDQTDYCSVFYFSLGISIVCAGLMCACAPLIGSFYRQPVLTPLTRFMSLSLVFSSLRLIQINSYMKALNFRAQAVFSLTSTVISGGVGIALALMGFGVWSLAIQYVLGDVVSTIMAWIMHPWRPAAKFSSRSLRGMFAFGSKLLMSGFLNTAFTNLYPLLIGRLFPPAQLGYYMRAQQLPQIPNDTLSVIVSRVTFPMFSAMREDGLLLKRCLRKALLSMALVNFPLMVGLAVTARPLVLTLLTAKWEPCIPYLQWLCVGGALLPLQGLHLNVLLAQGRSDLFFKLEVIKKVLAVIAIFVTYRHGVMAMIIGQVVLTVLCYALNGYYTTRLLSYSWHEQIYDLIPFTCFTGLMGAATVLVGAIPFPNCAVRLLAQVTTGVGVYCLLCWQFRAEMFVEALTLLKLKAGFRAGPMPSLPGA
jgi:O-antigen/teichoic acid export membrane protein